MVTKLEATLHIGCCRQIGQSACGFVVWSIRRLGLSKQWLADWVVQSLGWPVFYLFIRNPLLHRKAWPEAASARGMILWAYELSSKISDYFIKFLGWTHGLILNIKHLNALEGLLRAKLANSSKEIKRLMTQCQVCALLEKLFSLRRRLIRRYFSCWCRDRNLVT